MVIVHRERRRVGGQSEGPAQAPARVEPVHVKRGSAAVVADVSSRTRGWRTRGEGKRVNIGIRDRREVRAVSGSPCWHVRGNAIHRAGGRAVELAVEKGTRAASGANDSGRCAG